MRLKIPFRLPLVLVALVTMCFGAIATPAAAQYYGTPTYSTGQDYLPVGAVPINASSGIVAAGVSTATLTPATGKTAYITGFSISGSGASAASVVTCTVTGLISATESYPYAVIAGVTLTGPKVDRIFNIPIPASAVTTNIVVSCPSFGSGNTAAAVNAEGYYK